MTNHKEREIRTADPELKAIHAMSRALDGLNARQRARVLAFLGSRTYEALGDQRGTQGLPLNVLFDESGQTGPQDLSAQ